MSQEEPGAATEGRSRPGLVAIFTSHWLAMVGFGLVLTGIVLWACLIPMQLRHGADNPYVGLAVFAAGAVVVLGIVVSPIGLHLGRRRVEKRLVTILDARHAWRRMLVLLVVLSGINLLIASQVTTRAVHAMESKQFCTSCHVMTPEGRAFDQGPHAGILCVDCHVGDGARGFLKSKLQGTHQLISVLTDTVEMPIEGAIESGKMVPSAETCEQCHWKEQPADATIKLIQRYAEDEANTPQTTLLTMNVGGTRMGGIHGAHHGEGIQVRFVATDAARQEIPLVEYENTVTGVSRTYVRKGVDAASLAHAPRLTMQCFDCHNRVAHVFQMPDRAIDSAITLGRMSPSLPFLKKKGVEILTAGYDSSAAAAEAIPAALSSYYASEYPDVARDRADDVAAAGEVLADIWSRNVFPDLAIDWGTYPDNRGHQTAPGCLRCHGGEHVAATGEAITDNCYRCHQPAAVGETDPQVLELLGVDRLLKDLQQR